MVGTSPSITWPVEPSMVMISPLLSIWPAAVQRLAGIVDTDAAGARHAGLAHAARHHRGMRGHAAAGGENAFGGMHAVDVLGARLDAHQDDLRGPALSAFSASSGSKTIAPDAAPGDAGRPWPMISRLRFGIEASDAAAGRAMPDRCGRSLRRGRSGLHWPCRRRS